MLITKTYNELVRTYAFYLSTFMNFVLFVIFCIFSVSDVSAKIYFHASKDSPFIAKKNVFEYRNEGVKDRAYTQESPKGFTYDDPASHSGYKAADKEFQEGYMYAKLFEAGGLGYFDAARHPMRARIEALATERKYRTIRRELAPYINKAVDPDPSELNHRWYMAQPEFNWYQKVFETNRLLRANQDSKNGFIYYKIGLVGEVFAVFKPASWAAVSKGSRDSARSKRNDKNERIQLAVFDLAREMALDDAVVIGLPAKIMYRGQEYSGILEPVYALPKNIQTPTQLTRDDAVATAVDMVCQVGSWHSFGSTKAGNICADVNQASIAGTVNLPSKRDPSNHVPLKIKHLIDQKSMTKAVLLSYLMWQQDAHSNNFITYWDGVVAKKMRVKGLDYEDALDLAEVGKRNLKYQNPRHKMLPFVDTESLLDERLIRSVRGWNIPLLIYYLRSYGIGWESIRADNPEGSYDMPYRVYLGDPSVPRAERRGEDFDPRVRHVPVFLTRVNNVKRYMGIASGGRRATNHDFLNAILSHEDSTG